MPCGKCNLSISPNKRAICSTCSNDFHTACRNLKTQTNFNNSKDSAISPNLVFPNLKML